MNADRIVALVVLFGFVGTAIMALIAAANASRARRVRREIDEMLSDERNIKSARLNAEIRRLIKKHEDILMELAQVRAEIVAQHKEKARLKAQIAELEKKTLLVLGRRGHDPKPS